MEKRRWSRDWEKVEWDSIREKLTKVGKVQLNQENAKEDIGISREEFVEYIEWLYENKEKEFWTVMLGLRLCEMGVEPDTAYSMCENPELYQEAVNMMIKEQDS